MPRIRRDRPSRRRKQTVLSPSLPSSTASPGRLPGQDAVRRQAWNGKSPQEVHRWRSVVVVFPLVANR